MSYTAVIGGVGPGLGESIARKFAKENCRVALLAHSAGYLKTLSESLEESGAEVLGVPTDLTDPGQVESAFHQIHENFGTVDILVNHASFASWKGLLDLSKEEFEQSWRVGAFGGFLCSQYAVKDMLENDGGTVIFTGATSAVRGAAGSLAFASAKFAVRGMAQSMAREFGPKGIHIAHVIIDGQIDTPRVRKMMPDRADKTFLNPDAIAESYWNLVKQDPSAWTLELDLRPHVEKF